MLFVLQGTPLYLAYHSEAMFRQVDFSSTYLLSSGEREQEGDPEILPLEWSLPRNFPEGREIPREGPLQAPRVIFPVLHEARRASAVQLGHLPLLISTGP